MAAGVNIVVFDWGGVLLRICRSWREGCERAGLDVRTGSDDASITAERQQIARAYEIGSIDCDTFCTSIADAMHGTYTPHEMRLIHDAWLIEEYEGVADIIKRLVRMPSITTGMLSNTNHMHWSQQLHPIEGGTARFPTARLLRHRHASHLLGVAKPDSDIYLRFETETGFSGDEVLFFDDLPDNIAAARNRGWRAEPIDHRGNTAQQISKHLATHGVI